MAISSCVSNSKAEPKAMPRKREKSRSDSFAAPSAIFDGIDMAARVIC